ncbi:MAG: hypothetical protein ACD_57C00243G0002 [uncultured bacterium]|nr:MAG: hypothetical protein ACD_57C00243G0002 [uncultured bacterium]
MPFFALIIQIFILLCLPGRVLAITDPLSVPNNKLGIHILFPDEIGKAADLVNSEGMGEWGYVVIPIQNTDRNREKWQHFFDKCKEQKIIPIIRVATSANGPHWDLPSSFDLVDFANFLGDLKWPVQNRYVIFLNEVNRSDEFGGSLDPEKYADFLDEAINIFKAKSPDFFLMPAGLDNAANDKKTSVKWSTFLTRMHTKQPDIFKKIDGWVSHAYPNPDFSVRPDQKGENKINSFESDLELLKKYTDKTLPVFITETGWSDKNLSEKQIGLYYRYAFEKVWNHPQIVAVAPFLLSAQDGPFVQFSFLNKENKFKEYVENYKFYSTKGTPIFPIEVIEKKVSEATSSPTLLIYEEPVKVLGSETTKGNVFKKLYNSFINLFSVFK